MRIKSYLISTAFVKLDKDHKIYDADEYYDATGWVKIATAAPSK